MVQPQQIDRQHAVAEHGGVYLTEVQPRLVVEARLGELVGQRNECLGIIVAAPQLLRQVDALVLVGDGRIVYEGNVLLIDAAGLLEALPGVCGLLQICLERGDVLGLLLQVDVRRVDGCIEYAVECVHVCLAVGAGMRSETKHGKSRQKFS